MPDAAKPQHLRIPGGECSTVDSRNPPTQNAFHCSAHSKPLLSRGLGSKAFLGRDVCTWLLLRWAFLPSTWSDQMRLSTSVETVFARLLFPPPKSIPAKNKKARCYALSRLSTVKAVSLFPRVSAVGAASPALKTHRVMGSLCLLSSGRHPHPRILFPRLLLGLLTSLSPKVPGPLTSLPSPIGSWQQSSVPWSPKESLSSLGRVCVCV